MIFIDAYNVLNVEGVLPAHLAGPGLLDLVALVQTSRYAKKRVLIVCDGQWAKIPQAPSVVRGDPSSVTINGVELIFSPRGTEADDVIEALLEHYSGSNRVQMVSSDRRLVRAARRVGASAIPSDTFLGRLAKDADQRKRRPTPGFRKNTPLDKGDLAYWMKEFGLGEPEDRPEIELSADPIPELGDASEESVHEMPASEDVNPLQMDDLLAQLIRESRLSINPVDLDMERWLKQHPPK